MEKLIQKLKQTGGSNNGEKTPLKIGIFGYTAVGKTTFLSTLYYLLASSKYPNHNLSSREYETNEYIKERVQLILSLKWDQIPPNQGEPVDLYLDLFRKNKHFPLFMKDYRGEDISRGTESELFAFFESCNGIMVCLSPENAHKDSITFARHQEINTLLNSLVKYSRTAKTETPIVLVITKYDIISENLGEYDPYDLMRMKFRDTFNMLNVHAKALNVFAISAKGCVENRENPNIYEKLQSPHSPINIAQPLFWIIDQIESLRWKPFRIGGIVAAGIVISIALLFMWASYSKYNGFEEFAEKNPHRPELVLQKYQTFYDSFWATFLPVSDDSIQSKIKYWYNKYEETSFKRIVQSQQDYQKVLPMIAEYYEKFPTSKFRDDIKQIHSEALKLKREHEIRIAGAKRRAELEAQAKQGSSSGGGGCFIATSVYGSYNAPQVMILREFRDNTLNRFWLGRQIIKLYYHYSPPVADWLSTHKEYSQAIRVLFLDPIISYLKTNQTNTE